jgi:hypothetical protein
MSLNLIHNLQIKLSIFIYLTCALKTHINKIQKNILFCNFKLWMRMFVNCSENEGVTQ